jgi:BNR repeat-like domain
MKRADLKIAALGLFFLIQTAWADWSTAKRLTWNSGYSYFPTIAVDSSGNLHVVWQDDTPGNPEIFCRKSTDGGATWMASSRLTWNSGDSRKPVIVAASSAKLAVVWGDNTPGNPEIFAKISTDGGAIWAAVKRLTWNSGFSEDPSMAADLLGNLHLVWKDSRAGNDEIYYLKSTDGGSSWAAAKRLTWTPGYSWNPAIAVDSLGHLHEVWQDDTPGNFEVYYERSTDGGANWTAGKRLTWTSGESGRPSIAVDSSNHLHLVWRDHSSGNWEIYYKKSTDGGANWSVGKRLTSTAGDSADPDIAVDSTGTLHLVWSCMTSGEGAYLNYRKSPDGGATWEAAQRITWSSGLPSLPVIVVDSSDNLHLVWYVTTPDNAEIYYKRYLK